MLSFPRALAAIIVGVALSLIIAWELVAPIKLEVSSRYVHRGDTYLVAQDFESAQGEYDKALHYNPHNETATEHKQLAVAGPTDPAMLKSFYRDHGQQALVGKIDEATKTFSTPKGALQAGVTLYDQGQFALARYPIEQATKMDPAYPEAWHYLGLTYKELGKDDASFRQKAEDAWKKRDALSPNYL